MQAVIMAGGKGSRLAALTKDEIPKPMAPFLGKPLLEWQLEQLKRYGIQRVTLVVGHLKEKIIDYFGDGSALGMELDYVEETAPLGTAGAFLLLLPKIESEHFLLLFGDIRFDIDLARMERFFLEKRAACLLFAHPNSHPYDSDLIVTDRENRVTGFDSKHNVRTGWQDNLVNAGIYILSRDMLRRVPEVKKTDFEKEILAPMAAAGEAIYAYRSPEYVKDVGTVDRIRAAEEEWKSGFPAKRNLEFPQRAVFLDRDGVINRYNGFVRTPDELELLPCAAEGLRQLNSSAFLTIVVSNQPVVARGETSEAELETIFNKMKTLLGREGAFVDDVFYCPHHPDSGFPGEVKELKIDCDCRKPKTGMLRRAAERYHLDLSACYLVGDTTGDIQCGKNAGVRTVLVKTGEAGRDGKYAVTPDLVADDLAAAATKILEEQ